MNLANIKILHIDSNHPLLWEQLQQAGFHNEADFTSSKQEVEAKIENYHGIVIRSRFKIDKTFLDKATNLQFIARVGAGLESIDCDYAKAKGIHLIAAPEGNANAVGEHAIGMLLSLFNNLNKANNEVKSGQWKREANRGHELEGKTIGIIGFGNMGKALCQRLLGFGLTILAYDKYAPAPSPFGADLSDIFQQADIVSLHIPLTEETQGMVNQEFLSSFKKPIVLMNSSRGPITPLKNLLWGLKQGILSGLALDVLPNEKINIWSQEEQILFDQLKSYPNTLFSPHVAGWTTESYIKINSVLLEKIKHLFSL